jgi:hypothetical protein
MAWISKRIPKLTQYKPRNVIVDDVNETKIFYSSHEINKDIGTANYRACRWRILAEDLHSKYSSSKHPAQRRKSILNRIGSHQGAGNILRNGCESTS